VNKTRRTEVLELATETGTQPGLHPRSSVDSSGVSST